VAILNVTLGSFLDVLLLPFRDLPPIAGLAAVSLLTALAMLVVVRFTSDQAGIAAAKQAIVVALFEIRLFNDDLPAVFRAQFEMLRQNAIYLRLSLVPMLWMIVPIALVLTHLEGHYGYAGLTPGQPVLVKAAVSGSQAPNDAALDAPDPVRVSTPAVWFPAARELVWKVTPERAGDFILSARINGVSYTKTLDATDRVVRRSPERVAPGLVAEFLHPSERPLPGEAAVTSITVAYPTREVSIFGWQMSWVVVYFVFSMIFAFLLKKPLGVAM
jgi:uncharacterized membrane protein (DUF106 family)